MINLSSAHFDVIRRLEDFIFVHMLELLRDLVLLNYVSC